MPADPAQAVARHQKITQEAVASIRDLALKVIEDIERRHARALTDARRAGIEEAIDFLEGAPLYSSSWNDQRVALVERLRQRAAAEEP